MITSINKLKSFGCYDEFDNVEAKIPDFKKINILYGANGSGKTTLSNLLYLLSKHCKGKTTVTKEYIDVNTQIDISSSYGKINHNNIFQKELDIYVFNSKFINDHVFNGTKANIEDFSAEVKLTNEQISSIDDRLNILAKRRLKLQNFQNDCESKLQTAWEVYSNEFQSKIKGPRLTGIKPTILANEEGNLDENRAQIEKLYKEYELKNEQEATILKLEIIKNQSLLLDKLQIDLTEIEKVLKHSIIDIADTDLETRINALQKQVVERNLSKDIPEINNWFKVGGRLLHLSKSLNCECPLCKSDLTDQIEQILSEYTAYFSDKLVKLHNFIDTRVSALLNFENQNLYNIVDAEISSIITTSLLYNIVIEKPQLDDKSEVEAEIKSLAELLKSKKTDPKIQIQFESSKFEKLERYVAEISKFSKAVANGIDRKLESLNERTVSQIVNEIKPKLKLITSLTYNSKENSVLVRSKKLNFQVANLVNKQIALIEKEENLKNTERSKEIAKLNAESKYVNIYLNHLGIYHFHIEKDKEKSEDNLTITYSKTGKKKSSLNHSLSEGEKTALAFAYFISKIRVERIEGEQNQISTCIIVIDDPISSLDDNRLFQTANLIDSFFFHDSNDESIQPCQLFVFSHNIIFIKYLYNALRSNSSLTNSIEEFYLCSNQHRIRKLPSTLKNFTNTYLMKLKDIIDYKEGKIDYEVAKNYLPNYIRIVLETFLSFKLALVTDSYDRIPGLAHLINFTIKELSKISDTIVIGDVNKKSVIKRLNHLKKISDHESHGNISRAETYSFISDDELKEFAKCTLQIMKFMDEVHFNKAKGLSS